MYETYKDLDTSSINGMRYYHVDDARAFPSITTILSNSGDKSWLEAWRNKIGHEEAERIRIEATDQGSEVHKYLELFYCQNHTIDSFKKDTDILMRPHNIQELTFQMLRAAISGNAVVNINEIALYSETLKFAGRCDVIGKWKGYDAVIDWKTSGKIKKEGWITDYKIQCTAYAVAHNEMFGTNIKYFVIIIGILGQPNAQVFIGNINPWIPYLRERINEFYRNF